MGTNTAKNALENIISKNQKGIQVEQCEVLSVDEVNNLCVAKSLYNENIFTNVRISVTTVVDDEGNINGEYVIPQIGSIIYIITLGNNETLALFTSQHVNDIKKIGDITIYFNDTYTDNLGEEHWNSYNIESDFEEDNDHYQHSYEFGLFKTYDGVNYFDKTSAPNIEDQDYKSVIFQHHPSYGHSISYYNVLKSSDTAINCNIETGNFDEIRIESRNTTADFVHEYKKGYVLVRDTDVFLRHSDDANNVTDIQLSKTGVKIEHNGFNLKDAFNDLKTQLLALTVTAAGSPSSTPINGTAIGAAMDKIMSILD